MNQYFAGFNTKQVTLNCTDGVKQGDAVYLKTEDTVDVAGASADFIGICTQVRDGYASVVLTGFVSASYSGTAPVVGYNTLCGDGSGGIALGNEGRSLLVVAVDEEALTADIIL